MQNNDIEREKIKQNATEYEQIKRGFSEKMLEIVQAGQADLINYTSSNEKTFVILSYICRFVVLSEHYKYIVESFLKSLPYGSFEGMLGRCEIFVILLSEQFNEFYNTYSCIDECVLIEFFLEYGFNRISKSSYNS